jgi:formamidopyrimidine-DNA glycosylase
VPELPEVETVRRQLEPELVGRRIERLRVLDERLTRPESPRGVERAVRGRRVEAVERRGKYLLVRLDGGRTLAMHLRMTGNLLLRAAGGGATADLMETERFGGPRLYESSTEPRHVRARFSLDDGNELLFTDVRRFGQAVVLDEGDQLEDYFAERLGVEPLSDELTPTLLLELAEDRKAPLKSFLLTQSAVAGIGNIYADEALWRARLHPLSPAGSMKLEHATRLVEGIVAALEAGLTYGGASIDDYRDARGERGSMQDEFLVHTREGEPCLRPASEHGEGPEPVIQRIVVGGRSTYYCPNCQERLRRRPRRRARRPARRTRRASGEAAGR